MMYDLDLDEQDEAPIERPAPRSTLAQLQDELVELRAALPASRRPWVIEDDIISVEAAIARRSA